MLLSVDFNLSNITDDSIIIAIIGYTTVFAALVLLFIVFNTIPKLLYLNLKSKLRKKGESVEIKQEDMNISGETNAAISMALYLYFNQMHDDESNIVTIKEVSRRYSPWSSKIYGVHNLSHKK